MNGLPTGAQDAAGTTTTTPHEGGTPPEGGSTPPASTGTEFTPITSQEELEQRLADRLRRERKKYADYDDLKAKAARLAEIEAASASDLDKAVTTAKTEARAEVAREYGVRLARGIALANITTKVTKPGEAEAIVDDLNLAKYVGDDGDVDEKGLIAAVTRLIPTQPPTGDIGQGQRGNAPSFDDQIREATKKGDVRTVISLQNQRLAQQAGRT